MSETTNNPAASSTVITDTQRLDWLIEWIDEYLNRDMPPACYMMTPDREDIDAKIRSESENVKVSDAHKETQPHA